MNEHNAILAPSAPVKVLLTIEEAAQALSLGRTYCYDLVMRKQIASIKLGRKRRIPLAALHEFVARQLAADGLGV